VKDKNGSTDIVCLVLSTGDRSRLNLRRNGIATPMIGWCHNSIERAKRDGAPGGGDEIRGNAMVCV
jgi:hypothetical protein